MDRCKAEHASMKPEKINAHTLSKPGSAVTFPINRHQVLTECRGW